MDDLGLLKKLADCNDKEQMARCIENHKPMTNADRIRSMSDEELAKWIEADGWGCEDCFEHKRGVFDTCDMMCKEHCLAWLQQPAKEVHHE